MAGTPREARQQTIRDAKRSIILEAALAVFERDGLEGASMRAIGDAAGYTAAAIYFHFPSKEAIYGELLSQSLDRLIAAVESAVDLEASAQDRLAAAAMAFFDFYAGHPRELDLGFYLFKGGLRPRGLSPELDARLNAQLIRSLAPVSVAARALGASAHRSRGAVVSVFAHAVGLLLMLHTGRTKAFAADARRLMLDYIETLLLSLEHRR